MENYSTTLGGIGLVICLAILWYRFSRASDPDAVGFCFKIYLALSSLLGLILIAFGLIDIPSPWDICFVLIFFCWNAVSVSVTFDAPRRLAVAPIAYVFLTVAFALYSVVAHDAEPLGNPPYSEQSRPYVENILFGVSILVVMIRYSWVIFRSSTHHSSEAS
jgi:hypothetical protein